MNRVENRQLLAPSYPDGATLFVVTLEEVCNTLATHRLSFLFAYKKSVCFCFSFVTTLATISELIVS